MPRIGSPAASATRATSSSKTSSAGSTGPSSSDGDAPYSFGSRSGPPDRQIPRSDASSDGTASTGNGGSTIGIAPARASARTYGMPSAISCWGGSPSGSGCVCSARRTSEVVTPTRGLLSIPAKATQVAGGAVDRIHTSGIGFSCVESLDRHLPPRRAAARRASASSRGRTSRSASSTAAGEIFAIEDRCSHDDGELVEGELDEEDCAIECPRHGSRFDLRTGKPLNLPAYVPVDTFPVLVEDGVIRVEVD